MRAHALGPLVSAPLLAALAACSGAPSESAPAVPAPVAPEEPAPAVETARLETTACRFLVPKSVEGEGKRVRCADLRVPENRQSPGRTITLHVAIVAGKPGGVPTIELNGGPGGPSDPLVGAVVAREPKVMEGYGPILEQGDLVFFDQRGSGRSIPNLACESDSCLEGFARKGIDLAAYDTQENADDVAAIAAALGAKQVNLHGISYGTRLGLEVSKRHPSLVRAMILDGVMPPDVTLLGAFEAAVDRILTRVFAACKADASCEAAYPDLEGSLGALRTKLDATPLHLEDPEVGPVTVDFPTFVEMLGQRLYAPGEAKEVPRRIHDFLVKDEATLQRDLAAEAEARGAEAEGGGPADPVRRELEDRFQAMSEEDFAAMSMATGLYLSVTCNDYLQHESLEAARAGLAGLRPMLAEVAEASAAQMHDACTTWPKRPSAPATREPSRFTGRTLVIGGQLDPATPSAWAERAASTLGGSTLVVVPDGAHGLMDACGGAMKGAFLRGPDGAVDTSCATTRKVTFTAPAPGAGAPTKLPAFRVAAARPALSLFERLARRGASELAATRPGVRVSTASAAVRTGGSVPAKTP